MKKSSILILIIALLVIISINILDFFILPPLTKNKKI